MDLEQGDIEKFQDAINKFSSLMEKLPTVSSNSHINVHESSKGIWIAVWIATVCCAVMLTLSVSSRADQIDQSRRLDRAQDELNIILQWAPQLKEIVQKELDKTGGNK